MSLLFSPLELRTLHIRNRIFLSPMCQYSTADGLAGDWHLVHLGSRAVGGAGLVMAEATAVAPEGRISPDDLGIWSDAQAERLAPITGFIRMQGAVAGIQLAHAGRKAGTDAPWRGGRPLATEEGGWQALAPSPLPFAEGFAVPHALDEAQLEQIVAQFVAGARRAQAAGFQVVEVHMAHGYLLHSFLSPLANQRSDEYGGSFENRIRLPLRVAAAVRECWPQEWPVFVRISATDWVEGGWDLAQSIALCQRLRELGVDLIDVSSGGLTADAQVPAAAGYQTPFAAAIRQQADIHTSTVGLITEPMQAEHILQTGQADAVALGREMLRDPYWPLHAARVLGDDLAWPVQYERAKR
jgi:2,4-dienoyl-CoA reductase-like NADH-dependent reductase (Old Yellow Enzyme family)